MGFRVWGLGFRISGLGGSKVQRCGVLVFRDRE